LTFIYRHLQGNPDQRQFTNRSGVLTGNDTSGHSGGSKQKNCAHFEESMKLGMDKP